VPSISASALRADLYRIIERVARTGQPVDVTSKGRRVRIVAVDEPRSRLDALTPHADDFVGVRGGDARSAPAPTLRTAVAAR
jgi:prevent-host-death family protein